MTRRFRSASSMAVSVGTAKDGPHAPAPRRARTVENVRKFCRRPAHARKSSAGHERKPRHTAGLRLAKPASVRQPICFVIAATIVAGVGAAPASAAAPTTNDPLAGPAVLFSERCSTCHNIGGGVKVGPDLLGVIKRRDKGWFAKFVRGPSAAIDGGDAFATELYKKFQPVRM